MYDTVICNLTRIWVNMTRSHFIAVPNITGYNSTPRSTFKKFELDWSNSIQFLRSSRSSGFLISLSSDFWFSRHFLTTSSASAFTTVLRENAIARMNPSCSVSNLCSKYKDLESHHINFVRTRNGRKKFIGLRYRIVLKRNNV